MMVFVVGFLAFLVGFVAGVAFLKALDDELIKRVTDVARHEGYSLGWREGYRAHGREPVLRIVE